MMKKKIWIAVVTGIALITAALYLYWPVGHFEPTITMPKVFVQGVTNRVVVETNQSIAQSKRCRAGLAVESKGSSNCRIAPRSDNGKMGWTVDLALNDAGSETVKFAFLSRLRDVKTISRPIRYWPPRPLELTVEAGTDCYVITEPNTFKVTLNQDFDSTEEAGITASLSAIWLDADAPTVTNDNGKWCATFKVTPIRTTRNPTVTIVLKSNNTPMYSQEETLNYWPKGSIALSVLPDDRSCIVDRPDEWKVRLNQDYELTKKLGITLSVKADWLEKQEPSVKSDNGKWAASLAVTPRIPSARGRAVFSLMRNNKKLKQTTEVFKVDVPTPYPASGDTFAEMTMAPPESIYGSHISVWGDPRYQDRLMVTGHAISSVCKVASAALAGFEPYVPGGNPTHFLGAGLANFDLRGVENALNGKINSIFEAYPALRSELGFRQPASHLVLKYYRNKIKNDIRVFSQALATFEKLPFGKSKSQMHTWVMEAEKLLHRCESWQKERGPSRKHSKPISLSSSEVKLFRDLAADPELASLVSRWKTVDRFEKAIEIVHAMPRAKRLACIERFAELSEHIQAITRLCKDFSDLAQSTGLLKVLGSNHTDLSMEAEEKIKTAISERVKAKRRGMTSLAQLSSGYRGALLVPFYGPEGEISFNLPSKLFEEAEGALVRDLFRESSALEFAHLAESTARRTQSHYESVIGSLKRRYRPHLLNLQDWLKQPTHVRAQLINDAGEVNGFEESWPSHAEHLVTQWRLAAQMYLSSQSYKRIAANAHKLKNDPKFVASMEACLLDSLLRGWKLAFSDDEMEKYFTRWMESSRLRAWESIWQRASHKGIDPRAFLNEGTVWSVARKGKMFVVRPLYVAHTGRTWVRHSGGVGIYDSLWNKRQMTYSTERDWKRLDVSGPLKKLKDSPTEQQYLDDLSESAIAQVLEKIRKELPTRKGRWSRISSYYSRPKVQRLITDYEREIKLAFHTAPEMTAGALISTVLSEWKKGPRPSFSAKDGKAMTALRRRPVTNDMRKIWSTLKSDLTFCSWPFPELYLDFSSNSYISLKKGECDSLLKNARRIDKEYVELIEQKGRSAGRSEGWKALAEKSKPQFIRDCIQAVKLLSEAERAIDGWDDRELTLKKIRETLATIEKRNQSDGFLIIAVKTVSDYLSKLENGGTVPTYPIEDLGHKPSPKSPLFKKPILGKKGKFDLSKFGIKPYEWKKKTEIDPFKFTPPKDPFVPKYGSKKFSSLTHKDIDEILKRMNKQKADKTPAAETTKSQFAALALSAHYRPAKLFNSLLTCLKSRSPDDVEMFQLYQDVRQLACLTRRAIILRDNDPGPGYVRNRVLGALAAFNALLEGSAAIRLNSIGWEYSAYDQIHALAKEITNKSPRKTGYSTTLQTGFNALDRRRYCHRIQAIKKTVGRQAVAGIRYRFRKSPNRETVEALVQLNWYSGLYKQALDLLLSETANQLHKGAPTHEQGMTNLIHREFILSHFDRILKSCVYSGGQFFGGSLFGKRVNNWHRPPASAKQIVADIASPEQLCLSGKASENLAQMYRKTVDGASASNTGKVGDFRVKDCHKSYTDLRAFEVESADGRSFIKVVPNTGENLAAMSKAVRMGQYLRKKGVALPDALPISTGDDPYTLVNKDIVAIRETAAPGVQMKVLAEKQGGQLTAQQEACYVNATLDTAVKGSGLPNQLAAKQGITNNRTMRRKLLERSDRGRQNHKVFAMCPSQKSNNQLGNSLYDALDAYIQGTWKYGQIAETGLVHDAILANYFLDGDKVTLIDVADDYVGSIGHAISIMLTQLLPADGTVTYTAYKAKALELISAYEKRVGRKLTPAQRREIIQNLSYHPYKFMSSDGKQLIAEINKACGLSPSATVAELASAMKVPANVGKVDAVLQNKELKKKYEHQLKMMEYSLMLMRDQLEQNKETDKVRQVNTLIDALRQVQQSGARIARYDWFDLVLPVA